MNDHIPINIHLSIAAAPPPPTKRYALQKLNTRKLLDHLRGSNWENSEDPLSTLQDALWEGLEIHCPKARPSPMANRKWSLRASELLAGTRHVRHQYNATGEDHYLQMQQSHQTLFKKELRRVS